MYSFEYYWREYSPIALYKKNKNFVRNIYRYRRFLWQDRDWDFDYVYLMLEPKFRSMEEGVRKRDMLVRSQSIAKELMIAKNLCNRINEDYDFANYIRDYIEGSAEVDFLKNINEPMTDKHKRVLKQHHELHKANKQFLWNLMSKKNERWWD